MVSLWSVSGGSIHNVDNLRRRGEWLVWEGSLGPLIAVFGSVADGVVCRFGVGNEGAGGRGEGFIRRHQASTT